MGANAPLLGKTASDNYDGQAIFEQVYSLVRRFYYDKMPTDTQMARGTVKAMITSLEDANSFFYDPQQYAFLEAEGRGRFAGIGAALTVKTIPQDGYNDHKIVVVSALPGSPAEKAGLKPGDTITHVEGRWILGYNPLVTFIRVAERFREKDATEDEFEKARLGTAKRINGGISYVPALQLLRGDKSEVKKLTSTTGNSVAAAGAANPFNAGKAATEAVTTANTTATKAEIIADKASYVLTIQRPGVAEPLKITVGTGVTEVEPVVAKTLPDGTRHIRVRCFTENAGDAFVKAVENLPATCPGILLDLRGNPGGTFSAAQKIQGVLAGGKEMAIEVGARNKRTVVPPMGTPLNPRPKVTVLVDKGTASTAEALAASLAEQSGATLVGATTFGDAQVVSLYTLPDGSAFTLTTGRMTTPKQVTWAGKGLLPKVALVGNLTEEQILARASEVLRTQITTGESRKEGASE
jgi:carboxyl-terminal processing protease